MRFRNTPAKPEGIIIIAHQQPHQTASAAAL